MDGRAMLRHFAIGDTPLIGLRHLARRGRVSLKAEYANPFGSVKDRTAAYLLAWARSVSDPGVRVVESTSGNLGVALTRIGAAIGLRTTLVMDASLPPARVNSVRQLGADVELVRQTWPGLTFRETRIALTAELGARPGSIWLDQYSNPAGMRAHQETTGPEIWFGRHGTVDAVVASVGTGGTICGIGFALQEMPHSALVVGVEPVGSTIFGGCDADYLPAGSGMRGKPAVIKMFGGVINLSAQVPDQVAARWALTLRERFRIRVGQTTGAAVAVAVLLAERYDYHAVAVAADHGDAFLTAMRRLASAEDGGGEIVLRSPDPVRP
jgi:cysteine synthase